ncbi:MAG: hypothetical protein Alpg2KO_21030 [Alphaproteobacteria bacterium]
MPLPHYGVLTGHLTQWAREVADPTPHFQILLEGAAGEPWRVPVNVRSRVDPPDLVFHHIAAFDHPITDWLQDQPLGWQGLSGDDRGLDYLRMGLLDLQRLRSLPHDRPGPDNDLSDVMEGLMAQVLEDPDARIHAFGSRWGPEPERSDIVFGFTPTQGVHDIHMNQGNGPRHAQDNGPWQDGALMLELPEEGRWIALFLAFQSQHAETSDSTGHPTPLSLRLSDHAYGHVAAGRIPGPLRMISLSRTRRGLLVANLGRFDLNLRGAALIDDLGHSQPLPELPLPAQSRTELPLLASIPPDARQLNLVETGGRLLDAVSLTMPAQTDGDLLF